MAADLYWDSTSHHEIYQLFIHILSSQQPSATWVTYALHSAQSTCWVDWNCSTKTRLAGATAVAHWNWQCLGSTETQVQSPAPHSRLRIRRCHSCSLVCSCALDLIPGPRVPCAWVKQTKKKDWIHRTIFFCAVIITCRFQIMGMLDISFEPCKNKFWLYKSSAFGLVLTKIDGTSSRKNQKR